MKSLETSYNAQRLFILLFLLAVTCVTIVLIVILGAGAGNEVKDYRLTYLDGSTEVRHASCTSYTTTTGLIVRCVQDGRTFSAQVRSIEELGK